MYSFTIPMALMDFVPVVFFGITAVALLGDLHFRSIKRAMMMRTVWIWIAIMHQRKAPHSGCFFYI